MWMGSVMDEENKNLAAIPKDKKKKREPGKRCAVMFCNVTNTDNVSLHQFPRHDPLRRQWIQFVLRKREDDWKPGSGHICSNHFSPDSALREWGRNWPDMFPRLLAVPTQAPCKQ